MLAKLSILSVLVLQLFIEESAALRCWDCSSDIDRRCGDTFNFTNGFGYQRNGGAYDRFQQNYNDQNNNNQYNNNQYNNQQNYPSQYDQNYQNFGNQQRNFQQFNQQARREPELVTCNDQDARLSNMKNVCVKRVTRRGGSNYVAVTRRCEKVPFDTRAGTCYDPVSRGITLEFCEYCEYDGCNSASGLRFNVFLGALIPIAILYLFKY